MVSSCFLGREELTRLVTELHPDALAVGALADFARANSKGAVDLVRSDAQGPTAAVNVAAPAPSDADAVIMLAARPVLSCYRQSDLLSLAIDVRVLKAASGTPVLEKTYGGKLLGSIQVTSPAQYRPLLEKWSKNHAGPIFWAALRALLRQPELTDRR
jgi:hypothetical protein